MRVLLLVGMFLAAFLLRIVALSAYPVGFTPDEASFGYDAYSLLNTGRDQWGQTWPLSLRSFGDFKLPLYAYLTIPSVAIFGLNELAVRLPNVLFGTLAVVAVYLLTGQIFKDKRVRILSVVLLAISPWHVSLSRGAFEANLTTFFLPFASWLFLRGIKNPALMTLSFLFFGLNMFTYHSARFLTPLIVLVLLWLYYEELLGKSLRSKIAIYLPAVVVSIVFSWGILVSFFSGGAARGSDIAIFNPTDHWSSVADRRYEAVLSGFPDAIERLFNNKLVYFLDQFIGGYVSYLSPQFLFTQGAGEWTYGMIPGRGVLYLIEVVFLAGAVVTMIKNPMSVGLKVVVLWVLLSPIPAALAKGPGFAANRAAVMMPALQILSAYGGVIIYDFLRSRLRVGLQNLVLPVYIVVLFASLGFFLEDYFYHAPRNGAESMLYGRQEAVKFVSAQEDGYKGVIFSRSLSEPHIYTAFYNKWDPRDYQKQSEDWLRYEKEGRSFVDQLGEYSLGKYTFTSIDSRVLEKPEILLVGKPNEFSRTANIVHSVKFPNGKDAIWIVSTSGK